MKIINKTENELLLKDGNFSKIFIGIIFCLFSAFFCYQSYGAGAMVAVGMSAIFFIVGLVLILTNLTITVDFNKLSGKFNYQKKSLIKKEINVYNFSDVVRIETRKQWEMRNSSGGNGISTSHQVLVSQSIIILKDGTELPLDNQKDSSGNNGILNTSSVLMGGLSKENAIANQVAIFLGVPFQEISPMSNGTGINVGEIKL
jgi:hypothetical protein